VKIVLSTDEVKFVRRKLPEYKKSCIIDSREIIENLGYGNGDVITNITHNFIINQEIEKKLLQAINSKRINQIVYFNFKIDVDLIESLTAFLNREGIEEVRLILFDKDESNVPLWTRFDEIKK
jgi:hypothetical protein